MSPVPRLLRWAATVVMGVVVLGWVSVAVATTLRVPSDYDSINHGLDAAAAGDTVLVAPGIYTDYETRGAYSSCAFMRDGVVLRSEGGSEVTTIDLQNQGSGARVPVICASLSSGNTIIEGFRIQGSEPGRRAEIRIAECNQIAVRDCHFEGADSGEFEGAAIYADLGELFVENCTFRDCVAAQGSAIKVVDRELTIEGSVFENCSNAAVLADSFFGARGRLVVRNSRFVGNEKAIEAFRQNSITIEDCWFEDNRSRPGSGGAAVAISSPPSGYALSVVIRRNVFWKNHSVEDTKGALYWWDYPGTLRRNIFYGNTLEAASNGSAFVLRPDDGQVIEVSNNVIAANTGGEAVRVISDTDPVSSGNLFWNNPGGDGLYYPFAPTDMFVDPEYCDPDAGDFSIAASSPCLPENHFPECPDPLGPPLTIGCPSTGNVIVILRSVPDGPSVSGDADEQLSPALYAWSLGTSHTIGCDSVYVASPGVRYLYASWSDGGARVHDIATTLPVEELTASYATEYSLAATTDSGGTVTGEGWGSPGEVRQVTAVPDSGYEFDRWIGGGIGSYTGTDNPATVTLNGPVTQTALFLPLVYPLTMAQQGGGTVTPPSGPHPRDSTVEITAAPGFGYLFGGWEGQGDGSYTGPDSIATVTMNSPITQTALFPNGEFELEVLAGEGGSVTPTSGPHTSFSTVEIQAIPDTYHVFREWKGQGDGSYTGPDATATVTLNGPITQVAHFDPSGYELTLSLSDTDPYVHAGPPLGLGHVYLWLACGSADGGLSQLHADVSGDMPNIFFTAAPSLLSDGGTDRQLRLVAVDCLEGPVILGEFVVLPPGEGTMCLATTAETPELYIETCGGNRFAWPADVKVTGISTSGTEPCSFGRGCSDASPAGTTPVAAPTPFPLPAADEFLGGFPNPFTETTSIRFALARPERVQITVYDVSGRRVRRLVDSEHPAGVHATPWSGRDDNGRFVPAGVYFVRLECGAHQQTQRVVRLGAKQ